MALATYRRSTVLWLWHIIGLLKCLATTTTANKSYNRTNKTIIIIIIYIQFSSLILIFDVCVCGYGSDIVGSLVFFSTHFVVDSSRFLTKIEKCLKTTCWVLYTFSNNVLLLAFFILFKWISSSSPAFCVRFFAIDLTNFV